MARPMKDYRAEINGNSLKLFERGEYVGSLPVKFLVELAKVENAKATILQSLQKSEPEKLDPELLTGITISKPPKEEVGPERPPSAME